MFTLTSSWRKFLPNSWPAKVFPIFLALSTPVFSIFSVNLVVQFSMKKTPFTPSTITLKPPCPLLPLSTKYLPPTLFRPKFPCLTSPSWNTHNQPRTQPLTLPIPLHFPGLHYPTRKSLWTSPFLPSQENIATPANVPVALHTPAGN